MENRLIRLKEVVGRVGIRKSKIYSDMEKGLFPRPIRLGPNSIAWLDSDIEAWIAAKVSKSKSAA